MVHWKNFIMSTIGGVHYRRFHCIAIFGYVRCSGFGAHVQRMTNLLLYVAKLVTLLYLLHNYLPPPPPPPPPPSLSLSLSLSLR